METSLANNCSWLLTRYLVEQLSELLARAEIKAVESGKRKHRAFNNSKKGLIAFIQCRTPDLKGRLVEARVIVRTHSLRFNCEATR